MIGSTPTLAEFDPIVIPMQARVLADIQRFDYSLGTHEILLSGSVGSSKSLLMAHIAVRHALENKASCTLLGRRALPDLKDTIYRKIIDHLQSVDPRVWTAQDPVARVKFMNASNMISRSWADKHYSKLRSLEVSLGIFEELTENDDEDSQAYMEAKMRVGRLPHVGRPLIVSATNPDSPSHWAYKYFIEPNTGGKKHPTRHVYYSRTEDNPFLPRSYIDQLKRDLDPKMARRMLYGEWIEIAQEVIYYEYNRDDHYREDGWKPSDHDVIQISFDFNIGDNKPMSAVALVYKDGIFHTFAEAIVHGARTADLVGELLDRKIIRPGPMYEIDGDATGKARSTNSKKSDYEIIKEELDRAGIKYAFRVPLSNPAIRQRHNIVNAYLRNTMGDVRFVNHGCKILDEGLRLTALKKGANIVEDDSKPFQHVTTALGYAIVRKHKDVDRGQTHSIIL